ncbi:CpsD/CapB family tyrosine-protein kinase [Cohnella nanjingensis]|uniref:non-specific protein-tyrosine kinase n=1 Tax=Cohnella nanjingensis TaxID=1387779 RepID=A0A7X0VGJ3_9BACL|nr:CpsD/CapB family tyrosine-protein kinase [Cohnella nanjingensis]MBB6671724.1 CpsD/CapB family tyrosine-protein kinase [Cohnella nanjingensis]
MTINVSTLTAKRSLITHLLPYSQVADQFRTLRNLVESAPGGRAKVIAVTSAEPQAGKTTTAVNLAIACAQGGRAALLIDGSLRRPALQDIFSEPNHLGLSSVLQRAASLTEAIRDVGIPNLSVLTSGPPLAKYSDPLESERMTELLAQAKARFDIVIVDTPALLAATDATTLAAKSDGILWVVHGPSSKRASELEAKKLVERMSVKVIGCVLNDAKPARKRPGRRYAPSRG